MRATAGFLIALACAFSGTATADSTYHYLNRNFGYGFDVVLPFASLAVVPVDGNGEEFSSLKGHAKMQSWATPLRGGTLNDAIIASVKNAAGQGYFIASKLGDGKNWYEFIANKDDQTVIVRFLSVCRGKAAAMVRISYPTSEDALFAASLKVVRETMRPNFTLCKI